MEPGLENVDMNERNLVLGGHGVIECADITQNRDRSRTGKKWVGA